KAYVAAGVAFAACLGVSRAALGQAEPQPTGLQSMPVDFGADEVRFDVRERALVVTGHVHVDEPPFHLTSEHLQLRRVPFGVELDGGGEVSFCPCLGTPLAVRF